MPLPLSLDEFFIMALAINWVAFVAATLWAFVQMVKNRRAPHIVNRNLAHAIILEVMLVLLNTMLLMRSYLLQYGGPRELYPAVKTLSFLCTAVGLLFIASDVLFKLYILTIKFMERGVHVSSCASCSKWRLLRRLTVDVRMRRGQQLFTLCVLTVGMSAWAILMTWPGYCLRVCKGDLPTYGSPSLFLVFLILLVLPLAIIIVMKLWKLGPIDESLGLLQEIRGIILTAGLSACGACLCLLLMDVGVVDEKYDVLVTIFWVFGGWFLLWFSHLKVASAEGYGGGYTCSLASTKVFPVAGRDVVQAEAGASLVKGAGQEGGGDDAPPPPDGAGRESAGSGERSRSSVRSSDSLSMAASHLPSRQGDPIIADEKQAASLLLRLLLLEPSGRISPGDDTTTTSSLLTRLDHLAKRLLSREAVQCSLAIVQLETLSRASQQDREAMRSSWLSIMETHLMQGSPLCVSINEGLRPALCQLITRAARRKVLFSDDCRQVNEALTQEVLKELFPVVQPVLVAFLKGGDLRRHLNDVAATYGSSSSSLDGQDSRVALDGDDQGAVLLPSAQGRGQIDR